MKEGELEFARRQDWDQWYGKNDPGSINLCKSFYVLLYRVLNFSVSIISFPLFLPFTHVAMPLKVDPKVVPVIYDGPKAEGGEVKREVGAILEEYMLALVCKLQEGIQQSCR